MQHIAIQGQYQASPSSLPCHCKVFLQENGNLWLTPEGGPGWLVAAEDIQILPVSTGEPVTLLIAKTARLTALERGAVDSWAACHRGGRGQKILSRRQNNAAIVLAIFLAIAGSFWGIYRYAIPALSKPIAFMVPVSVSEELGQSTLDELDATEMRTTSLSASRQDDIRQSLEALNPPPQINLQFRSMRDTVNAFALPDGTVVVTDALVSSLETDEVQAVLAHEIAHVTERHGLQMIVRSAALPIAIGAMTGDFSFMLEAGGILALMLASSSYSRDMESEADAIAVGRLHDQRLDPLALAEALRTITAETGSSSEAGWFSSHPDTDERIAEIEYLAGQ